MYIRVYVCIGDVMKMKCVLSKDGVLACCLNLGFPLLIGGRLDKSRVSRVCLPQPACHPYLGFLIEFIILL